MKHFRAREVPVQHRDLVTTLKLMGNSQMLQKGCLFLPTGLRIGIGDPAVEVLLRGRQRS